MLLHVIPGFDDKKNTENCNMTKRKEYEPLLMVVREIKIVRMIFMICGYNIYTKNIYNIFSD